MIFKNKASSWVLDAFGLYLLSNFDSLLWGASYSNLTSGVKLVKDCFLLLDGCRIIL